MTRTLRLDRRAFIRATRLSLGLLPRIAADGNALAASAGAPKRIVFISWPNGVVAGDFWPDAIRFDPRAPYPPPGIGTSETRA